MFLVVPLNICSVLTTAFAQVFFFSSFHSASLRPLLQVQQRISEPFPGYEKGRRCWEDCREHTSSETLLLLFPIPWQNTPNCSLRSDWPGSDCVCRGLMDSLSQRVAAETVSGLKRGQWAEAFTLLHDTHPMIAPKWRHGQCCCVINV